MDIDHWKMIYGFILLAILGTMGMTFAHGKVEANTSFGLMPVITTLSTLAGAFAGWAFQKKSEPPPPSPPPIASDRAQQKTSL